MRELMFSMQPATWRWLLKHELRLGWREMVRASTGLLFFLAGILWIFMHLGGWFMMRDRTLDALLRSPMLPSVGLVFWFGLMMMLSASIVMAVRVLYDRGDLDLLLSSPLSTRTVFAVRGLGIALQAAVLPAFIVLPLAHMGIVHGQWGLLAAYPVLFCLGLWVASLALALTLLLVRLLGVRRARIVAQIIGAVAGALLFFVSQVHNLVPDSMSQSMTAWLRAMADYGGWSPLWWPIRALFGDPVPLFVIVLGGAVNFLLVVNVAHGIFLSGTQEAMTASSGIRSDNRAYPIRFRNGLNGIVIRKELLLIARDPNLIAQTLLQILYLVPLIFIAFRHGDSGHALAPAIIVVGTALASSLSFITVGGEEASDLIDTAPVARERIRWLKVAAAILPIYCIAMPMEVFYLVTSWRESMAFVFGLSGALVSVAVVQVWCGKPTGNRDIRQRAKASPLLNFLEIIGAGGWAGAAYGLLEGFWWAGAGGVAVGLIAPLWAWSVGRLAPQD